MRYLGEAPRTNAVTYQDTQPVEQSLIDRVSLEMHLTDEQKAVLLEVEKGNSVVVDSCIGSGKTRVLQAVCNVFPHSRILYLTYNRLLKLDAQDKIQNRTATVQNYHGFVYRYLSRRGIRVSPDKQIKTFLSQCSDVPIIYDMILVDEYQDLEEDTTELLLHIAHECPRAQWVFVGDMQQKIYDKTRIDVYKDCIDKIVPNYIPLAFTQSFRISQKHADYLSELWHKRIYGVNENCKVSVTHSFNDILTLLDSVPNKDVLILGPRYGLTQEIVNILERRNPKKYNKETVWTSIRDKDENFPIRPNSLIVTTFDGCKGMERPICIVIDWTAPHYATRVQKPFVNQQIITNLFCVAASRGKEQIIFFSEEPERYAPLFSLADLATEYEQVLPTFNPSTMFQFKFTTDILKCMENLTIEDIPQEDTSIITSVRNDGNIDLSPAVGLYQEIVFFKHYDFDKVIESLDSSPLLNQVKGWIKRKGKLTAEQKALALTAIDTGLFRYCSQASDKFMTPEVHDLLLKRLSSKLNKNTTKIQVPCHFVSADFSSFGYMDYVDKRHIPWELKFVTSLSNEMYLQLAMYILSTKAPYGYLWNTMTNTLKKVSIKDKEQFVADVFKCITLGRQLRRNIHSEEDDTVL